MITISFFNLFQRSEETENATLDEPLKKIVKVKAHYFVIVIYDIYILLQRRKLYDKQGQRC